jgi:hypothetical protein
MVGREDAGSKDMPAKHPSRGARIHDSTLDRETAAAVTLWRAVIIRAITDFMWRDRCVVRQSRLRAEDREACLEAAELFFNVKSRENLEMLCDLADLDADYVQRMIRKIISGELPMPTAQAMGGDRRVIG